MSPVTVPLGTVAEICPSFKTLKVAFSPFQNRTPETPVKPDPWMKTVSPGLPSPGENEPMT